MGHRFCFASQIIFLGVVLRLFAPNAILAIDMDAIAMQGSEQARKISSFDLELRGHVNYDFHVCYNGGKYRVELWDKGVDRSKSQPKRVVAFDGQKYYMMQETHFVVSSKSIVATPFPVSSNPLFVPYQWLLRAENEFNWDVICNSKAWRDVLSKGRYIGESDVDGIACHRVRLKSGEAETDVWFARDYGCFPMRWVSRIKEQGRIFNEAKVTRYKMLETEAGSVLIPLEAHFIQPGSKQALKIDRMTQIPEDTLKVNEHMDGDLFILTPTHRSQLMDMDNPPARMKNMLAAAPPPKSEGTGKTWFVILNIAGIVILLLIFSVRYWRRRLREHG